jgi:hypothetical protein
MPWWHSTSPCEVRPADTPRSTTFGTGRKVVGVFEASGSVLESEIWADLPMVQSLFNRNNVYLTNRGRWRIQRRSIARKPMSRTTRT